MEWYLKVLKQYVDFKGRARRKEYWMFMLFNVIFAIVAMILDNVFGTTYNITFYGFFYTIYCLAVFLPGLGVSVRRLHDTGKSGWFMLLALIPFIGPLIILVFTVLDSDPLDNKYGPNPKIESETSGNSKPYDDSTTPAYHKQMNQKMASENSNPEAAFAIQEDSIKIFPIKLVQQNGIYAGHEYTIQGQLHGNIYESKIGRPSTGNQPDLGIHEQTISRLHASLFFDGNDFKLQHHSGNNSSSINGSSMQSGEYYNLSVGDKLSLANIDFEVKMNF